MSIHRYTSEELRHLRDSPLVKKPDRLPPIEQWIEYVYVDDKSREKLRIPHSEAQQITVQTDKLPKAVNPRMPRSAVGGDKSPMGNFSTGQRPSLMHTRTAGSRSGDDFMSSLPKTGFSSTRSITRITSFSQSPIVGTPRDEQDGNDRFTGERQHTRKPASTFDRENWTHRKVDNEHVRTDSNGDRLGRSARDGDKPDSRWSARERQTTGWRDREAGRNRPWDRNDHNEQDPEWFDEPASSKQDNDFSAMSQPRTQEDFQKWKESMSANKKPQPQPEPEEPTPPIEQPVRRTVETLKIDALGDRPFGGIGSIKSPDSAQAQSKSAKSSRFASMFKKEDSPQSPAAPEPPPASAPPALVQENREDKEGFQRILQMLGGTSINTVASPAPAEPRSPPKSAATGARQRSRFFDSAKSPDLPTAPVPSQAQAPQSAHPYNGERPQETARPPHERSASSYGGASTPDINLQSLLASQRAARPPASNKDSEFLLGLLQGAGARPASQAQPPVHEAQQFPQHHETYAPKPRNAPPPGQIDEHLLRNAPMDIQRLHSREAGIEHSFPQQAPRPPPGFDDQMRMMQPIQQRNVPESNFPQHFDQGQPRRPPGLPPGMPMPPHMMHQQPVQPPQGQPPQDMPFMQPPGLPPHMRPPPGYAGMPIYPPPQQQMQQPPHFQGGPPPMHLQPNGGPPPGLGRAMPPINGGQPPPGLMGVKNSLPPQMTNGNFTRGPQTGVYEQRR